MPGREKVGRPSGACTLDDSGSLSLVSWTFAGCWLWEAIDLRGDVAFPYSVPKVFTFCQSLSASFASRLAVLSLL
jgi:hypothetical protein